MNSQVSKLVISGLAVFAAIPVALVIPGRPWLLAVAIGLVAIAVGIDHPRLVGGLFMTTLVFVPPQGVLAVGDGVSLAPLDLLASGLLFVLIGTRSRARLRGLPLFGPITFVIVVRAISALVHPELLGSGILSTLRFVEWAVIIYFFAAVYSGESAAKALRLFTFLVSIQSAIAFFQLLTSRLSFGGTQLGGTLGAEGALIGWLSAAGVLLCLGHIEDCKGIKKLAQLPMLFVLLLGLVASLSRTAWITVVIAIAIYYFFAARRMGLQTAPRVLLMGAVFLGCVSVVVLAGQSFIDLLTLRTESIFLLERNASVQERFELWVAGWNMFLADPLFGVGTGNYVNRLREFAAVRVLFTTHNAAVNVAAETGVAGIVSYLVYFVSTVRYVVRNSVFDQGDRRVNPALISALGALLVAALVADFFGWTSFVPWSGMLLGLFIALNRAETIDAESQDAANQVVVSARGSNARPFSRSF